MEGGLPYIGSYIPTYVIISIGLKQSRGQRERHVI